MTNAAFTTLALLLALSFRPVSAAGTGPPVTVSPGRLQHPETIEQRCPTFSWARVDRPGSVELVVHRIDAAAAGDASGAVEVLRRRLPSSVSSYTPALDRCPKRGGLYSWRLRVLGEGLGEEATVVSDPRWFSVEPVEGIGELEARLRTLGAVFITPEGSIAPGGASAAEEPISAAAAGSHAGGRREARGGGAGGDLTVDGEIVAQAFEGDGTGVFNVVATNVTCSGCVEEKELADGSVGAFALATGAVNNLDFEPDTLTSVDFDPGSVDSDALSWVTAADIGVDQVVSSNLVSSTIAALDLKTIRAVAVECDGECSDGSLGDVCDRAGTGWDPLFATSPHGVPSGSSTACGGDNVCLSLGELSRGRTIDSVCPDGGGWDCLVFCMAP